MGCIEFKQENEELPFKKRMKTDNKTYKQIITTEIDELKLKSNGNGNIASASTPRSPSASELSPEAYEYDTNGQKLYESKQLSKKPPRIPDNKIHLLIYGYLREIGLLIPVEIFELIKLWQTRHPNLIINVIYNQWSFELEIYLDSKAHKLLNIDSYKINYGKIANYNKSKWSKYSQNYDTTNAEIDEKDKKTLIINKNNIKSDNHIAFIKQDWINGDCNYHPALFECFGLDKNGKILLKSAPITCTSRHGWLRCGGPIMPTMTVYNFKVIDIENKGFVTLNEWILSLKKLNILNDNNNDNDIDELLIKRIFYYINFSSNRHIESELKITDHEFEQFCKYKYDECEQYNLFRSKIKKNKKCSAVVNRFAYYKSNRINKNKNKNQLDDSQCSESDDVLLSSSYLSSSID